MVYKSYLRKAVQKESRPATLCMDIVLMFCGVRLGVQISCLGPRSQSIKHWTLFFSYTLWTPKYVNFKMTTGCFYPDSNIPTHGSTSALTTFPRLGLQSPGVCNYYHCCCCFRKREHTSPGERQRERQNLKQAPYSERSLTWGSVPQVWEHDLSRNQESDAQPTEPCATLTWYTYDE